MAADAIAPTHPRSDLMGNAGSNAAARRDPIRIFAPAAFLLFACVLTNAWVVDDAYITFRTVDNFIHNYGPTWNVDERVQAYTHPLWMFVISASAMVTGEVFFTSIAVSLICTLAAVVVVASPITRRFNTGFAIVSPASSTHMGGRHFALPFFVASSGTGSAARVAAGQPRAGAARALHRVESGAVDQVRDAVVHAVPRHDSFVEVKWFVWR